MSREALWLQLERLYTEQRAAMPVIEGNPCGDCAACCHAEGVSAHRISDLELGYIGWKVGPEAERRMREYVGRKRVEGELVHPRCPHYDLAARGCSIYPYRPFSCRVFGHFREAGTRFPDTCTLAGSEVEFERDAYYAVVPGAVRLRRLMCEFSLYQRHGPPAAENAPTLEENLAWLNREDPADRALEHLAWSRHEEALTELLNALEQEPTGSPFIWHTLGLVHGLLERPDLAVDAFRQACRLLPDQPECFCQLGTHLLLVGQVDEGIRTLKKVLEMDPGHGVALGMLGYCHLLGGEPAAAAEYLEGAVRAEPENLFYRLRLANAWLQLGRVAEARPVLERLREVEAVRIQAEELLAVMDPSGV